VKLDENETPMKLDDGETIAAELSNEELKWIQGGAPFSQEELVEVKGILNHEAQHHGVNLSATIIQGAWGTAVSFGAYAAGEKAGNKVKHKKN
jgi:hypothetical protein